MQLQAQLKVGAALLLAVAASISAYVFIGYAQAYRQSTRNLQALTSYDHMLKAGNAVSAERAPSNILLCLDPNAAPAYAATLTAVADARHRTDIALDQLDRTIRARPDAGAESQQLARARILLAQARAAFDALSRNAPTERSPQKLQAAIDALITVRAQLDPLIDEFYGQAVELAPAQAGIMQMARMLSDLREYGGRLASMLVVPLSTPEPIGPGRRLVIANLRGRLNELHSLIPERFNPDDQPDDAIDQLRAQVERGFFGHTLALVDMLMGESNTGYTLRAAAFTSQVLPDLVKLEQLEGLFMQRAIAQVTLAQRDDRRHMRLVGACLLSFFVFLLGLLQAADRLVIRPLSLAKNEIIGLAQGELRRAPRAGHSAETRALHDAIDTLKRQYTFSMQLAIERDELSKALRRQAHTDALTGLLNRHALEEITGDLASDPVRLAKGRGLILIDVDYFKPINDEHGHIVGDLVLREVARRIRRLVREPHLGFRYGGEEFAVLTTGLSMSELCQLAEDIRRSISHDNIHAPGVLTLTVTASFGVAKGSTRVRTWLDLLNAADTALYQAKAQGRNQIVAAPYPADEPPRERHMPHGT
ncbi:MAG TPA: GGDEF domain-containing protein [Dyella sp.]|uniref:GGDEF domain-containing protein n=1 Tax=Dyella sp. TaxID=1869338 RepID=UPI002C7777A2|nr:GGDEF domain-containing protein [Dyella sp.]HUB88087.1 GGDEF domain-containing protein [Dyella sp.]